MSVRPALAAVVLSAFLLLSCKHATQPPGNLSGQIVRAPGQTSPVFPVSVVLYGSNPFAPGATPLQTINPAGSDSVVTFKFGDDVAHGDYYVVAWRDDDFDHAMDSGDLLGWYDGGTTAGGAPSAIPVHKDQGQNVSITIRVGLVP